MVPFGGAPRSLTDIGLEISVALPVLDGLPDVKFVYLIDSTTDVIKMQTIAHKVNVKVVTKLGVKLGNIASSTAGPARAIIGTTAFKAFRVEHGDNTVGAVTVVDLNELGVKSQF